MANNESRGEAEEIEERRKVLSPENDVHSTTPSSMREVAMRDQRY